MSKHDFFIKLLSPTERKRDQLLKNLRVLQKKAASLVDEGNVYGIWSIYELKARRETLQQTIESLLAFINNAETFDQLNRITAATIQKNMNLLSQSVKAQILAIPPRDRVEKIFDWLRDMLATLHEAGSINESDRQMLLITAEGFGQPIIERLNSSTFADRVVVDTLIAAYYEEISQLIANIAMRHPEIAPISPHPEAESRATQPLLNRPEEGYKR
ncbi:hypothetical protein [Herpetosiphon giganteus]|uniref:hypothetical protein n=1 Tax=Herpetosiphon giganteus TaxID=2029754 RepID=UPI00195D29F6|nr:hypothetical protein [Herpetosiphon giganteus]MBM7846281.1 hypothetical protein [Herpetosiphon giganteus]